MDGTCKTCRFWKDDPVEVKYANVNRCLNPKVRFGNGRKYPDDDCCSDELVSLTSNRHDDEHVIEHDEAAVVDGSGYFAAFMPGPDFGCILHEPVETTG